MGFQTSREIAATPAQVYQAFTDSERLARWWGPAGFTSTFTEFGFEPGARWTFTMHGPDGRDYANEIVVNELEPDRRLVLHHVSGPHYLLTVTLDATAGGTRVDWDQEFENPDVGRRLEPLLEEANEELFDRLATEVTH